MIAEIEDALIAAISAAPLGYTLGKVASYGGELASDTQSLAALIKSFPTIWVMFNGEETPKQLGTAQDKWWVKASFFILVATRNVRGERFTRHSANTTTEIGAYQISEDLRTLLIGQDLGLNIADFNPGPIKSLFNKKLLTESMAVFTVELKTQYVITQPADAGLPDWLTTGIGYFLNPADSVAVASDTLTMRS